MYECDSYTCWARGKNLSDMKKHIEEKHESSTLGLLPLLNHLPFSKYVLDKVHECLKQNERISHLILDHTMTSAVLQVSLNFRYLTFEDVGK